MSMTYMGMRLAFTAKAAPNSIRPTASNGAPIRTFGRLFIPSDATYWLRTEEYGFRCLALFNQKTIIDNMKAKTGFNLRNVCGEQVIVAEGRENIDFSNIISMNETSAYLWNAIQGKDFTVDDLVKLLTQEYDVDEQTARKDAQALAKQWLEAGICE